jgi:hypothetical protein
MLRGNWRLYAEHLLGASNYALDRLRAIVAVETVAVQPRESSNLTRACTGLAG